MHSLIIFWSFISRELNEQSISNKRHWCSFESFYTYFEHDTSLCIFYEIIISWFLNKFNTNISYAWWGNNIELCSKIKKLSGKSLLPVTKFDMCTYLHEIFKTSYQTIHKAFRQVLTVPKRSKCHYFENFCAFLSQELDVSLDKLSHILCKIKWCFTINN